MLSNINNLISIIIPVYNQESYIEKCLYSIQNQSYRSYEVIIINDGSNDKSEECILKFIKDERFKYYSQQNSGVSSARNKGLALASGTWVTFIDPDDYISPDYLEVLLGSMRDRPELDLVIVPCITVKNEEENNEHFYKESFIAKDKQKQDLYLQLFDPEYARCDSIYTAVGVPWGKLYKTSIIKHNNITFKEDLNVLEDNLFNMEYFYYAREIKYCNYFVYYYRLVNSDKKGIARFINGGYRKTIKYRTELMKKFGFDKDIVLRKAWIREQISILTHEVLLKGLQGKGFLDIYRHVKLATRIINKDLASIDLLDMRGIPYKNKIQFLLLRFHWFFFFSIICILKRMA